MWTLVRRTHHTSVVLTYDRYGHLLSEIDKLPGAKLDRVRGGVLVGPEEWGQGRVLARRIDQLVATSTRS
jgi:hypothetical protein